MFKVNNKGTTITPIALFCVFIVNFEDVITDWGVILNIEKLTEGAD